MATPQEPILVEPDRSLATLLKELAASVGQLLQKESELARAEMLDGVREAQRASRWFAIALVPAAVGLVLIALSITWGLGAYMPMWLAALIPAVVLLGAAAALAVTGKRRASHVTEKLKPEQAVQSLRETRQFLGEQLNQIKTSVTSRA